MNSSTKWAFRDIFLVIEEPSIELTNELMKKVNVVIATGGAGMVKAAYSSGKPSFGVGPGNVQGIIDRDVDIKQAASNMIASGFLTTALFAPAHRRLSRQEKNLMK